jgi:hypothetical protein
VSLLNFSKKQNLGDFLCRFHILKSSLYSHCL